MKIDAVALIDTLKSEKQSYQELLDLSKQEQEMIIKKDIEGLSGIVKATEHQMLLARDLGNKRTALISQGTGQDLSASPPELSSIIKDFDEHMARQTNDLKDEMLAIIKELDKMNQANAELLKRGINYNEFLLGVIMPDESPIYTSKPNPQRSKPKLFDGRA